MTNERQVSEVWRQLFSGEMHPFNRKRNFNKLIPSDPRCKLCYIPFRGLGGKLMGVWTGLKQSKKNPYICDYCEKMAHTNPGGAEITLTLLFADIRGSTAIAEKMSAKEFSHLINRFCEIAGAAIVRFDGMIDKFIGDAAVALFIEGVAGSDHAAKGLSAAREILLRTGHGRAAKPWVPVGIGVLTGVAWVGSVGSQDGGTDITALGDVVNTAARLGALAREGEILATEETLKAAGEQVTKFEIRTLALKGKEQPIRVNVIPVH